MDDVAADRYTEVTADRTRSGILRVGCTHQSATLSDHILALPDHGNNGSSAGDVSHQAAVEGFLGKVDVVLLGKLLGGDKRLHRNELVATLLESRDDFTHDLARDAVGLDHDIGALSRGSEFAGDGLGTLEVDSGSGECGHGEGTAGSKSCGAHVARSSGGLGCASGLGREGTRGGAESGDSGASEHIAVRCQNCRPLVG